MAGETFVRKDGTNLTVEVDSFLGGRAKLVHGGNGQRGKRGNGFFALSPLALFPFFPFLPGDVAGRWPTRPSIYPRLEGGNVSSGERVAAERHARLNLAFQHQHQPALAALAWHDGRSMATALEERIVSLQNEPAHLAGTAMASEALASEDRFDLGRVGR